MKPIFDLKKLNTPNLKKQFSEMFKNSKTKNKNKENLLDNLRKSYDEMEDIHNPLLAEKSKQLSLLKEEFKIQISKHHVEVEKLSSRIQNLKEKHQNLTLRLENKKVKIEQKTSEQHKINADVIIKIDSFNNFNYSANNLQCIN